MILTQLSPEKFFHERTELREYTDSSEVYDLLYTAFIEIQNLPYWFNQSFSAEKVFNDATMLCTMVLHDDNEPFKRYADYWDYIGGEHLLLDGKGDLLECFQSNITMWLVYGLLSLIYPKQGKIDRFLIKLQRECTEFEVPCKKPIQNAIEIAKARGLQLSVSQFPVCLEEAQPAADTPAPSPAEQNDLERLLQRTMCFRRYFVSGYDRQWFRHFWKALADAHPDGFYKDMQTNTIFLNVIGRLLRAGVLEGGQGMQITLAKCYAQTGQTQKVNTLRRYISEGFKTNGNGYGYDKVIDNILRNDKTNDKSPRYRR